MDLETDVKKYFKKERFEIAREVFISIIFSAVISGLIGFYFTNKVDEKVGSREFIYNYSRTFFDNPKYRNISVALEDQYLYGKEFLTPDGKNFKHYDIDDFYSLVFDIWSFYKSGFISREVLDQQYGYYLCIIYNASETHQYRVGLQREGFSDDVSFLDEASNELGLKDANCKLLN